MTATRRRFLTLFLAGVLLAGGAVPGAARATAGETGAAARTFIESLADNAIDALTSPNIADAEREARFRSLLNAHFAVETIGKWVLGRYWRKATPAQQQEYLHLFEDLIVGTYVDRFKNYTGESLSIIGVVEESRGVTVKSEIIRPGGQPPVQVAWRLSRAGEGFKVVDVVVEGVSMSQTQRSEFGSVISRRGGIDGLLAALREKTGAAAR